MKDYIQQHTGIKTHFDSWGEGSQRQFGGDIVDHIHLPRRPVHLHLIDWMLLEGGEYLSHQNKKSCGKLMTFAAAFNSD